VVYLPQSAVKAAELLRTPTTKVCFLTAYGYFTYAKKFFNRQFHGNDIVFVAKKLGFPPEAVSLAAYQKDVYQDHKARILDLCGIRKFDEAARRLIEKAIAVMQVT